MTYEEERTIVEALLSNSVELKDGALEMALRSARGDVYVEQLKSHFAWRNGVRS